VNVRLIISGIRNTIRPTNEGYLHMRCDMADETPATSSAIAALRAEGVEMFAESQKAYVRDNRSSLDPMMRASYCGSAVDAEKFARQLRESKGESKL
jgi:hypothetical protein